MNLDIVIYGESHADTWLLAFKQGLQRHGINARRVLQGSCPIADLVVFWGHRRHAIIEAQCQNGFDYLVMERGYFGDRMETWTSCGFNGLNGRAQFHNENSPADRWLPHVKLMKPWRTTPGEYVLIMGQVAGDASIKDVDITNWYRYVYETAEATFDLPVCFRPHPLSRQDAPFDDVHIVTGELRKALGRAHVAITYNSNSGVDAALAGIPVIAFDRGSMAWEIAAHEVEPATIMPERSGWAQNLAYCQWTMDEIRSGIAWDHLRQRYV